MDFYYKEVPGGNYCITQYVGKDKHVEFPSNINITILHDDIFKGNTTIESIVIPESVTQIGGFMFDGATNLKSIKLPKHLEDMWQYAFTRTQIEEIEIPGTVKSIVPYTFFDSRKLRKVIINEGTTKILGSAFKNCTGLRDVYLPSSIEHIHEDAFIGCHDIVFHNK